MIYRKRILISIIILAAVILACTACGQKATTMQLVKTEGEVDVINDRGRSMDIFEEMGLYSGYHVDTRAKSQAWINLDSTKLTKMDEESQVEVKGDKGKLEMIVHSGRVFFHVTEPLDDGETLEIRTSTMLVGIRETCGWVEVPEENHMKVYLIEGTVECSIEPSGPEDEKISASVSGGDMADMRITDGQAAITVSSYGSGDIPDFVLDEISGDELLASELDHIRIQDFLSGMEDVLAAKDYDTARSLALSEEYLALAPLIEAEAPCYSRSRGGAVEQNGTGVIAYGTDVFYYGSRENGVRNGQGVAFRALDPDSDYFYHGEYKVYEGNWANDMPNGQGTEFCKVSAEKLPENTGLFTMRSGEFADGLFNGRIEVEEILWDGSIDRYYGTAQNGVWDLLDENRHYLIHEETGRFCMTIEEESNQRQGVLWVR